VPEQLTLEQAGGQRRAVHLDERPLAPRAEPVQGTREQLLAGPGLAVQQHRRQRRRHLLQRVHRGAERLALSDELRGLGLAPDLVLEVAVLGEQAVLEVLDLGVQLGVLDGDGGLRREQADALELLGRQRAAGRAAYEVAHLL
jgi:hypothetical protein